MTYQEIKDRLSQCELTLEKIKNGTYNSPDVKQKTEKLEILRESYTKLLKEAEKTAFINGNPVEYEKEDELKKYKDNSDVKTIKTAQGKDIKEQEGLKFNVDETKAIAKKVGKAVAIGLRSLGDQVKSMKATNIEEGSFEIQVNYKGEGPGDEFSFYIVEDTLHLTDFSFDKELVDVGVKPSGEAVINVDVLANELAKHWKSQGQMEGKYKSDAQRKAIYATKAEKGELDEAPEGMYYIKIPKDAASQNKAQVIFNDLYGIKYEINDDPDGIFMYFKKEDFDAGVIDDLEGDGVNILDTNIPVSEGDYKGKHQGSNYKWPMSQATKDRKEADKLAQDQKDHDEETYDREIGENEAEDTEGGDLDIGHQDDEPDMLKQYAYDIATYASKLYKALDKYDKYDGEVDFPNWWQSKVILARDYISKAQHYLEFEEKQPAIDQLALEENVNKIAGGIPYKREGNKFIITEPLDDATKERIIKRAKEHGHQAAPNMAGGVTIMAKEGKEGISKEKETKFHKDLDTLVHNTFGKRKEEMDENRFLAASMEDLEQVIRNLAHTGEMSEDEAIELAIRKLEAMLDGRDDIEEGRKDNDALFPDNPRLPQIKKLADKIVSMVKAEAAKGELGYINTMEEIRYQQEDDFERTPEWNKAKGIRSDFDDYGSGTNEGIGKTKKALDLVITKMKELAKQYKAGDKSVVDQLKDLTAKKKSLEAMLDSDVSGKGVGQELAEGRGDLEDIVSIIEDRASDSGFDVQDEAIEVIEAIADHFELGEVQFEYQNEAQLNEQATCCGKCGRVHVKGTKCKTPYLKGKDHCRNN